MGLPGSGSVHLSPEIDVGDPTTGEEPRAVLVIQADLKRRILIRLRDPPMREIVAQRDIGGKTGPAPLPER